MNKPAVSDPGLALVRLLQLASPALPIGAYSYSQGLEWVVGNGVVHDAPTAQRWIGDLLDHVMPTGEAAVTWRLLGAARASDWPACARWNAWFRASRETAELAKSPGGFLELDTSEGIGIGAVGTDAEAIEKRLSDQMRWVAPHRADAEIDARLAEAHWQQLRVAIGEVQQRYVPEWRQVVERFVLRTRSQRKTGRRRGGERLQELATRQRHLLTGDSGSSKSATRCVICSSVSTPLWPKRGMLEQAENASEL